MNKYIKEIVILLLQLVMFYIFPLSAGPSDMMGMVVLIIISVFITSILIGALSSKRIKYLYPIVISILFIPSVFIYYNESALIHSLWYLIISIVGFCIGTIINKLKYLKK